MWSLKLCDPYKSNLLAFQDDWLTAHLNKNNPLPKHNMSRRNITFMKNKIKIFQYDAVVIVCASCFKKRISESNVINTR